MYGHMGTKSTNELKKNNVYNACMCILYIYYSLVLLQVYSLNHKIAPGDRYKTIKSNILLKINWKGGPSPTLKYSVVSDGKSTATRVFLAGSKLSLSKLPYEDPDFELSFRFRRAYAIIVR